MPENQVNTDGMELKFLVLKREDIDNLNPFNQLLLERVVKRVTEERAAKGKQPNSYLIINTDEPYAGEVIKIMKRHGHEGTNDSLK